MNIRKYSPALLTLLVFLLAQGLGTVLFLGIAMIVSPEFNDAVRDFLSGKTQELPLLEMMSVNTYSIILIVVDILAVMGCYFILHYIRPLAAHDFASIRWQTGSIAIAAGILGAVGTSILTEKVPLPDIMVQMSYGMAHSFWGIMALAVIGPITEELLFREAIEGEMLRRGARPWAAIIISAAAFGFAHLNLAQGLYAIPLAIIFGIIYYKTGNIILTALLHILNNSIVALQLRTPGTDTADPPFAEWLGGTAQAYTLMLICGILSLVLIRVFCNRYQADQNIQKKALP